MNWAEVFDRELRLSDAESALRLWIGGDICPSGQLETELSSESTGSILEAMPGSFRDADFRIANLEVPLTRRRQFIRKSGPVLRAEPECARGLRSVGFDVLSVANNHIMDHGPEGLADTTQACQESGILTVGAGRNLHESCQPLFLERQGIRVGIVAAAEREFSAAGPGRPGAAPLSPRENWTQIQNAKEGANCVLFIVHGGNEYYELPRPRLQSYCRFLIDSGASAVVCHHTHIVGPIEIYRGRPIAYGLGNLLFPWHGPRPESWYRGMGVELSFGKEGKPVSIKATSFAQSKDQIGISRFDSGNEEHFRKHFSALCDILTSEERLEAAWRAYCFRHRQKYLLQLRAPVLFAGVGWILRRAPWLERFLLSDSHLQVLINLLRCDSHRDVAETTLELTDELRGRRDEL